MLIGFYSSTENEVQALDPVDALAEAGCQRVAVREAERQRLLIAVLEVMAPGDTLVMTDWHPKLR